MDAYEYQDELRPHDRATLLRISEELAIVADGIGRREYLNAQFDAGYLMAAVRAVRDLIDPECPEMISLIRRERNRRLLGAIQEFSAPYGE